MSTVRVIVVLRGVLLSLSLFCLVGCSKSQTEIFPRHDVFVASAHEASLADSAPSALIPLVSDTTPELTVSRDYKSLFVHMSNVSPIPLVGGRDAIEWDEAQLGFRPFSRPVKIRRVSRDQSQTIQWQVSVDIWPGSGHAATLYRVAMVDGADVLICVFAPGIVLLSVETGRIVGWEFGPYIDATLKIAVVDARLFFYFVDNRGNRGPWLVLSSNCVGVCVSETPSHVPKPLTPPSGTDGEVPRPTPPR